LSLFYHFQRNKTAYLEGIAGLAKLSSLSESLRGLGQWIPVMDEELKSHKEEDQNITRRNQEVS